ncbi:hypothetical protein V2W45_1334729 [Cenococcum geophilum]
MINNKLDNKVGNVSDKAGDVSDKVGDVGDEMGDVSNKVGDVGDEVGDISDEVGDKGDKVGSSNKDKENSEKVNGEDKPKEISIDKEITNLLNAKLKPPKSKFWVKDAIKAKFGPNIEYTTSITIKAEGSSVKEIIIAKNINGDWNWYNKTRLLKKLEIERLKGGNPVKALTKSLKKIKLVFRNRNFEIYFPHKPFYS